MFEQKSPPHSFTNGVEEDDPVVQRIPVHLSKGSAGQLFLFESSPNVLINNLDGDRIVKSRIKPKQQKVELHLKLDVESSNFNRDLARKLASGAPKTSVDASKNLVETQILTSSLAVPQNPERFAIAVAQSDGIHLNPLSGIVYLKPSFGYLDTTTKKREQKEGGPPTVEAAKPVTVKFSRQSAKQLKSNQVKADQQKMQEEEPWCDTEFFDSTHINSIREREKLNCDQTDQDVSNFFCETAESYLPVLCPSQPNEISDEVKADSILSANELSKLPLNEQIKERMKQMHLTKFSRLKRLLGGSYSEQEIISGLCRVADLIKGNWVLKSSLLFDKEFTSIRGVCGDRLAAARDKILLTFKTNDAVICKKLAKMTKIPADDVIEILKKIADKIYKVGWKFKLEEDTQFLNSYPEIADKQKMHFDTRIRHQEKKEEEEAAEAKVAAKKAKLQTGRQRKNSTRSRKDSQCSDIGS
ncbi:DNA-directed RNA polymerase III subunit RPC5 [Cloeon dipterum]|uniref:DNA-directed RNA polymerase III subunit RPC5 n=1 Tax=Cloeon dipterum TaxID=197152 RepID=UPI0032207794